MIVTRRLNFEINRGFGVPVEATNQDQNQTIQDQYRDQNYTECVSRSRLQTSDFFAIFLATARNFYTKFHNFLLIHNHTKLLTISVIFLIMTKLLNFLGNHVVIFDVHGMYAERKTHHILYAT